MRFLSMLVRRQAMVTFIAAAIVPFFWYVLTLSPGSYWLDAGEFVAAATDLDISHPPGHPVEAIVGRAFAFIPLGSLAWRVALASASFASIAAGILCLSVYRTVRRVGVRD